MFSVVKNKFGEMLRVRKFYNQVGTKRKTDSV